MASLSEIAFDLLTTVKPHLSDDNDIDLRQIKFWIHNQRSLWIRNDLNKGRAIDDDICQVICMDTMLVDKSDCCDVTLDCTMVRSVEQLPSTIGLHDSEALVRIGPVDRTSKPYSFVEFSRVPFVGHGRFNKNEVFTFTHNGYVYAMSENPAFKSLKAITVKGVFENPTEAANFTNCETGVSCYSDDDKYPIKTWMLPAMKEAILKSNLLIAVQAEHIADKSNNAESNPVAIK